MECFTGSRGGGDKQAGRRDCFRKVTFPWGKLGYYPVDDLTGAGQEISNGLRSWEGLNLQLEEV